MQMATRTSLRISLSHSLLILLISSWCRWYTLLISAALILSAWMTIVKASSTCFLAPFSSEISCCIFIFSTSNPFLASSFASVSSTVFTLSGAPSRTALRRVCSLWISLSLIFITLRSSASCCLKSASRTAWSSFILSSWSLTLSSVTTTVLLCCSCSLICLTSWFFSLSNLLTCRESQKTYF